MRRSVGKEGNIQGLSEESSTIGLWQAGKSETYTDDPYHIHACPSLRRVSTSAYEDWVIERGFREQT